MKKLLFSLTKKDFRIDTLRGHGKGGQARNKRDSAVRVTHPPSGAVGFAQDSRSQAENRKLAFRRMHESATFQTWMRIEIARREMDENAIEREVAMQMHPSNINIEYLGGEDE